MRNKVETSHLFLLYLLLLARLVRVLPVSLSGMHISYAALSLFAAIVSGYSPPRGSTGDANVRDPGLMRRAADGVYFLFSTGDKIKYARSSSLDGPWTHVGSAVPAGSVINKPGKDDLWVCLFFFSFLLSSSMSMTTDPCVGNEAPVSA